MEQSQPPLNYQASAGQTNHQISTSLPPDVVQCLKNARFLHLATCTALHPHVSLMNYTYLPSSPFTPYPAIIMTTNPSSRKTQNLLSNPNVSLLVHDWVSHRPARASISGPDSGRAGSPPAETSRSSLATLLANLNTSALSSISATINGKARLVERGTDEEGYFRKRHLEENTFGDGGVLGGGGDADAGWPDGTAADTGDGGRGCFIEGEEVRVVVVRITDGRVADWKGGVRDWTLSEEQEESMVNGV